MNKISNIFLLAILLVCNTVNAQAPATYSSADILSGLKKLNVLGSVLYFAAHPDDENTKLLAYLSKEKLYRTGYLSLTRGDGGQNLIGNEQGVELGLIRTQELLAARRIDGAEQFFSTAFDFGFSKSTEEALKTWGEEKILANAVWVIRKFQPDVIITRFPEDSRAGHGHHSASAVIAREAFIAAADPKRFPEQFAFGVKPWQAKRILWNTFNFGGANTISEDQFKIDIGGYNALLGKSYGEIAAQSRSQHKSQGFGVASSRGQSYEYFKTTLGNAPKTDLMDDVNTTWNRVEGGKVIAAQIDAIIKNYSSAEPGKSVPALVTLYQSINKLKDGYWKEKKLAEVQQLIEACAGLYMEASTNQEYAVQGDSMPVNLNINNREDVKISLIKAEINNKEVAGKQDLEADKSFSFPTMLSVATNNTLSQPYWLVEPMQKGSFTVNDQTLIGKPQNDPAFEATFVISVNGQELTYKKPLFYKFTDPVKGELYEPLVILPAYRVEIPSPLNMMVSGSGKTFTQEVKYIANKDVSDVKIYENNKLLVDDSKGLKKGQYAIFSRAFDFNTVDGKLNNDEVDFNYYQQPEKDAAKVLRKIQYDHIPNINYFSNAVMRNVIVNVKTVGKKIGYIKGAGDKVPEALAQMGYDVTFLDEKNIASGNLSQYDAIITGVRAYNIYDWLNTYHSLLMQYVENGGNLIVQYNTSNQLGSVKGKIGPYDFGISRARITDENAAVKILQPDHQILNFPNKITSKDFDGWIQERSIYHASNWDKHYETIFSMHDSGESDDEGSLITTKYGKGTFVYTGLVFFRELPAGVPGAYRLMANIIALNKNQK